VFSTQQSRNPNPRVMSNVTMIRHLPQAKRDAFTGAWGLTGVGVLQQPTHARDLK